MGKRYTSFCIARTILDEKSITKCLCNVSSFRILSDYIYIDATTHVTEGEGIIKPISFSSFLLSSLLLLNIFHSGNR